MWSNFQTSFFLYGTVILNEHLSSTLLFFDRFLYEVQEICSCKTKLFYCKKKNNKIKISKLFHEDNIYSFFVNILFAVHRMSIFFFFLRISRLDLSFPSKKIKIKPMVVGQVYQHLLRCKTPSSEKRGPSHILKY